MRNAQPSRPSGGGVNDGARREGSAATETVTVGQALQAVALSPAGGRPVDRTDASAIQAAEKSATTGLGRAVPGGVAAAAHQAAETNEGEAAADARGAGGVERKVTLGDVLGDAAAAMPAGSNRAATWVDAEKVAAATGGSSAGKGGGAMGEVADALAAAAQMNERSTL